MDRMVLGVVVARDHPVILSDLSRDAHVLDSGFWVVERSAQRPGPWDARLQPGRDGRVSCSAWLAVMGVCKSSPLQLNASGVVRLLKQRHAILQNRASDVLDDYLRIAAVWLDPPDVGPPPLSRWHGWTANGNLVCNVVQAVSNVTQTLLGNRQSISVGLNRWCIREIQIEDTKPGSERRRRKAGRLGKVTADCARMKDPNGII